MLLLLIIIIDLFFKGNKEHRKASKQKSKWNFLIWFYLALLPAKLLLQPIWKRDGLCKRDLEKIWDQVTLSSCRNYIAYSY